MSSVVHIVHTWNPENAFLFVFYFLQLVFNLIGFFYKNIGPMSIAYPALQIFYSLKPSKLHPMSTEAVDVLRK